MQPQRAEYNVKTARLPESAGIRVCAFSMVRHSNLPGGITVGNGVAMHQMDPMLCPFGSFSTF